MAPTGSYSLADLLQQRFASAAEFGLDTINEVLQRDLANYNSQVTDQMALFAEPLTKQSRIYGVSASVSMVEVDEFGAPPTQKNLPGLTVSFPLRLYKSGLGWTSKTLEIATPREIASKFIEARRGHAARLILEMRKALFLSSNYTFVDKLTNGVSLAIKRLLNADGDAIPNSPSGATFDGSTHDHYNDRDGGSLANVDIDAIVSDVTEHGNTRGLKIIIALADKTDVKALTGFVDLGDGGIIYNAADTTLKKLNFDDLENQLIGYWRDSSTEVWVKPWGVQNYALCIASGVTEKAVGFRQREQTTLQGLRILARIDDYPMIADNMEAEFGMGIWNRTAAAVVDFGNSSYTDPTLT